MSEKIQAAIIGAGPAGLFAAEKLALAGYGVVVFNRDIKPGGMAEYGIYPEKHTLKAGLRKQFCHILELENIHYYGNVCVGVKRCITLETIKSWGIPATLVACGAQGTKWLGIPGEKLTGVYHAKDLVYHYNLLPPFSQMKIEIGEKVTVVGAGNVMADVARHLLTLAQVKEIHICVRRGPAEVKFSKKELEPIIRAFDLTALDEEIARVAPVMEALGQDPQVEKSSILCALDKASQPGGKAIIYMHFLSSPVEILGDSYGNVSGVKLENNTLVDTGKEPKARGLGTHWSLDADTVIFAIGDKVEDQLGIPVQWNEFVRVPEPRFPVEGQSYEILDEKTGKPRDGVFVAGWSRVPSSGLVGNAKKDGINAASAVACYLKSLDSLTGVDAKIIEDKVMALACQAVRKPDLLRLVEHEQAQAASLGLEEFKYGANEDMLGVLGL